MQPTALACDWVAPVSCLDHQLPRPTKVVHGKATLGGGMLSVDLLPIVDALGVVAKARNLLERRY